MMTRIVGKKILRSDNMGICEAREAALLCWLPERDRTGADHVNISSFYFQKGFAMLCGFTLSEYIRNRRLALAGNDLATGEENHCAHGIIEENTIDECGAMTQAMIGYTLQKKLGNSLRTQGITADIVTVLTQVSVDKAEVLTSEPTKPIGPFYSKEEAMERMEKEGVPYAEDSNRGYRRVIASPKPLRIEEIDVIRQLKFC